MPRRQFVTDLATAQCKSLPGVSHVKAGAEDGNVEFRFAPNPKTSNFEPFTITALVPDVSEYPGRHTYMIYVAEDDAPREIASVLQGIRGVNGKNVAEMLEIVSKKLYDDEQLMGNDDNDDDDFNDSDHEAFGDLNDTPSSHTASIRNLAAAGDKPVDHNCRDRIRQDLWMAKKAGFRVGILGDLLSHSSTLITVSIRISKLGISEEAMQAWQLRPSEYLILVIHYPSGYKSSQELQEMENTPSFSRVGMRVLTGPLYKPTLEEAMKAFALVRKATNNTSGSDDVPLDEWSTRETFISKPLVGLLQDRLVTILCFRCQGLSWRQAEDWYNTRPAIKTGGNQLEGMPDQDYTGESMRRSFPNIVMADHCAKRDSKQQSFPLIAMQFLLRHFVRCTDFCLVCHTKLEDDLDAIKPYVCDKPLCLYQYMALGFGPSIEHEVLTQPSVVDLLVSFCYNSASAAKLKHFPDGLKLIVPRTGLSDAAPGECNEVSHTITLNLHQLEIRFPGESKMCPVSRGDWIVIEFDGSSELHCRMHDTTYYPVVKINAPISLISTDHYNTSLCTVVGLSRPFNERGEEAEQAIPISSLPQLFKTSFRLYEYDFQALSQYGKCVAVCLLLDSLPTVTEMQEYLTNNRSLELKDWKERISPAAMSLLRWIIASNRSCIMQMGGSNPATKDTKTSLMTPNTTGERVIGMKDFMQFRFAMGAPDKEQRFLSEVRQTARRLFEEYPTIFAWHGSPLYNWHTIIREGLNFDREVQHGRRFGDGVYHAKTAETSDSFSTMWEAGGPKRGVWGSSQLRIQMAMSLNEIVNAPDEFVSKSPHYVLQQLDWIQTRFLFVRCKSKLNDTATQAGILPKAVHHQHPERTPVGFDCKIVIPASAINKLGREAYGIWNEGKKKRSSPSLKRIKGLRGFDNGIPVENRDDYESVSSDVEDLSLLFWEDSSLEQVGNENMDEDLSVKGATSGRIFSFSVTDFVAGQLDFTTLPIMPMPTYASSATTSHLIRELNTLQKIQQSTPLADFGWSIDIPKIENVYQWIVELHSFHMFQVYGKPIPLAEDMKKKNVKSVVLEIRFNSDFPSTPPYIRVIRPIFLTIMQGGGGHIVHGGAMCMELLTNTGWSSASSMESVLMQVRLAIASEPFARLNMQLGDRSYNAMEACEGYIRACKTHDWKVPPGFKEMAMKGV